MVMLAWNRKKKKKAAREKGATRSMKTGTDLGKVVAGRGRDRHAHRPDHLDADVIDAPRTRARALRLAVAARDTVARAPARGLLHETGVRADGIVTVVVVVEVEATVAALAIAAVAVEVTVLARVTGCAVIPSLRPIQIHLVLPTLSVH